MVCSVAPQGWADRVHRLGVFQYRPSVAISNDRKEREFDDDARPAHKKVHENWLLWFGVQF